MSTDMMTYRLCVIGNPIQHSKSPWVHTQFAKQLGLEVNYTKIQASIENFAQTANNFRRSGGHGLNITAPFKALAYELADEHSDNVKALKAANTFLFKTDKIYADNTDGPGLVKDIEINHQESLQDMRILILGAGGATRGILPSILHRLPKEVLVYNRTTEKAQQLSKEFAHLGPVAFCDINHLNNQSFDLLIDATSTFNSAEILPKNLQITNFCYDLKYQTTPTSIMEWAKTHGTAKVADGMGMLIEQAALSFQLWTGQTPDTKPIIPLARSAFT